VLPCAKNLLAKLRLLLCGGSTSTIPIISIYHSVSLTLTFMTSGCSDQAILDAEQALNVQERQNSNPRRLIFRIEWPKHTGHVSANAARNGIIKTLQGVRVLDESPEEFGRSYQPCFLVLRFHHSPVNGSRVPPGCLRTSSHHIRTRKLNVR
jgi:hypothetical protein